MNDKPQTATDIEAIKALVTAANAQRVVGPETPVGDIPFVLVPEGYKVESLEQYLPRPTQRRGIAQFRDLDSFCRYVNEHKVDDTRIFMHQAEKVPTFIALLDFHGKDGASWHRHQARYTPALSTQWQRWAQINGQTITQTAFAQFLERNVADVSTPKAAELLELVEDIEAHVDARYESKMGTTDGKTRLMRSEQITVSGGASIKTGQFDLPKKLETVFPILLGGMMTSLIWRLRPVVNQGTLCFIVEYLTAEDTLRHEFDELLSEIADKTSTEPFVGVFQ